MSGPAATASAADSRRLLFVGIDYYSYTQSIVEALRRRGWSVDYYPLEQRDFWSKTGKKLMPAAYRTRRDRYHERILARAQAQAYDRVLFLQVHHFAVERLARLRASQPGARFVLYNWDALGTHDYRPYLRFFDVALTFDREDAGRLGIGYLPLFALPEYFEAPQPAAPAYDLYFVGAVGTLRRFEALQKIDARCRRAGLRFAKHLHCSPAVLLRLLARGCYLRGMTLRSLSTRQIIDLMNRSGAVFDFPNHPQSGYTMRLVENLCAGKRVVTSNANVRREPFYSADQFLVVDGPDFTGLEDFLRSDPPPPRRPREFSLERWLDRLLEA